MKHVILEKLGPCKDAAHPTAQDKSKQADDIPMGESPWTGYVVEGKPMGEPEKGRCFFIDRYKRNGEEVRGFFRTSPIRDIIPDPDNPDVQTLVTMNSHYKMTTLDE